MFMRNIDQSQFQPINTNSEFRALQGINMVRNEAIPNGEAHTTHPCQHRQMMKRGG